MHSTTSLEVEQITAVVSEAGQRIEELAHESTDAMENGVTDETGFVSIALCETPTFFSYLHVCKFIRRWIEWLVVLERLRKELLFGSF